MTIKQQGGVFGRNPSFNDVDAAQLDLSGNASVGGTLGVTGLTSLSTASINALSTATALNINSNNTPYGLDIGFLYNNGRIGSVGSAAGIDGTRSLTDFGLHGINNIDLCVGYSRIGSVTSSGIALANGKGIDFSATSGTGTSELFDDYEEGTWTPSQGSGVTVTGSFVSSGKYTKVGRVVTLVGQMSGSTNISVSAGSELTTTLPFTPEGTSVSVGSLTTGAVNQSNSVAVSYFGPKIFCMEAVTTTASAIHFTVTYFTS